MTDAINVFEWACPVEGCVKRLVSLNHKQLSYWADQHALMHKYADKELVGVKKV